MRWSLLLSTVLFVQPVGAQFPIANPTTAAEVLYNFDLYKISTGVQNYTLVLTFGGVEAPFYYELATVVAPAQPGVSVGGYRLVSPVEWNLRNPAMSSVASTQKMRELAGGARMLADVFVSAGYQTDPGARAYINPFTIQFLYQMGAFVDYAAYVTDTITATPSGARELLDERADMYRFEGGATLAGIDTFPGRAADGSPGVRETYRLDYRPGPGGTPVPFDCTEPGMTSYCNHRIRVRSTSLWIDRTGNFTPAMLRVGLEVERPDGSKAPVTLETGYGDYREGTPGFLIAHRQMFRMRGFPEAMAKDQKEAQQIQAARADPKTLQNYQKLLQTLASLPPAQQAAMRGRMAGILRTLQSAMQGDADVEFLYHIYEIDKGPPFDWAPGKPGVTSPPAPTPPSISPPPSF